jgi:hypothetical protein
MYILPTDLQSLFHFDRDVHRYQTHSVFKHLLHIPRIYTATYGNKSVKYYCPVIWNFTVKNDIIIDKDIKKNVAFDRIFNTHQFKRILKKHYLYTYTLE